MTLDSHYLDFTIDVEYQLLSNLCASIGFYQSLLLKAEWEELNGWTGIQYRDRKDEYSQFDRGLDLSLTGKKNKFALTLQYQYGLSKIIGDDQLRWLSLHLGYDFEFKQKR